MLKNPEHNLEVERPHILVADFERAMRVYRDILGFRVDFFMDALARVPWEMFCLPPEARCRVGFLSEGKGVFGNLAVTEATGIELPRPTPPYRCSIIIQVRSGLLFPMVEKLKAEGLEVGEPLTLDGPPRTDVSFSDHDGNRILIFEVYPREKKPRELRGQGNPAPGTGGNPPEAGGPGQG